MSEAIAVAIIGSGALSALISGIIAVINTHIASKKAVQSGLESGVRTLLYDRIKYLCKKHISRGRISPDDLEDIERMWHVYHDDLGGNGFLDQLMSEVNNLPIKPE